MSSTAEDRRIAVGVHHPRRHPDGRDLLSPSPPSIRSPPARRRQPALAAFIAECKQGSVAEADMATMEKKGMDTGLTVTHPLTGEALPVWVGNYVLMSYGEGAVMAVPAHDERDFALCAEVRLPIKQVIRGRVKKTIPISYFELHPGFKHGTTTRARLFNSGKYDGLYLRGAVDAIAADLKRKNLGEKKHPVPPARLGHLAPALLGLPDPDHPLRRLRRRAGAGRAAAGGAAGGRGAGRRRLASEDADVLNCTCPKCGGAGRRETDTMDTFVESSWYYARYACPDNDGGMLDARANHWLPVDQYIGGIEHAILHLLYARFFHKLMRDEGPGGKATSPSPTC
jgi:leucyl-tRNA synthetase